MSKVQIISIVGTKGGTGKTTASHMLAHGAALDGLTNAMLVTTDDREILEVDRRRYQIYDCRGEAELIDLVSALTTTDDFAGWTVVLDGGGNRPAVDDLLVQISDAVLLATRDSAEDLRQLIANLAAVVAEEPDAGGPAVRRIYDTPKTLVLPLQWPAAPNARADADRRLDHYLGLLADGFVGPGRPDPHRDLLGPVSVGRDRVLPPVLARRNIPMAFLEESIGALTPESNAACRELWAAVKAALPATA